MKKSKLFMAMGALALAITAIFATKANKRFIPFATAEVQNSATANYFVKASSGLFTSSNTNINGTISISGTQIGTQADLFTATSGSTALSFH
jgi:hypothetical protein